MNIQCIIWQDFPVREDTFADSLGHQPSIAQWMITFPWDNATVADVLGTVDIPATVNAIQERN